MYKYKCDYIYKIGYYLQIKEIEASSMRLSGEGSTCQTGDSFLDQKTPGNETDKPLQDFFPGKSHGQRSLEA